ncbi:T9SS type A sorting domain-containing protein [candidate division GN15 bacterium]|nr:T9SS type A sorting domain-containing protein [candidate division GN15 bacterium]
MRVVRIPLIVLLLILSASTFARTLDFVLDATFSIPTDTVSEAAFRDIDADGWPEALLVGGDSIWLYSLLHDSVLFTTAIPPSFRYSRFSVSLSDVNRDSVVDLIMGSFGYGVTGACVWDGASSYTVLDSVRYGPYVTWYPTYPKGVVEAVDTDRDGFDELVVSYDNLNGDWLYAARLVGGTVIYSSFPDVVLDTLPTQSLDIDSLLLPDNSHYYITEQRDGFVWITIGPDWEDSWSWLTRPWVSNSDSSLVGGEHFGNLPEDGCGDGTNYDNNYRFGCGGNLDAMSTGSEFIAMRQRSMVCSAPAPPGIDVVFDSTVLSMYSLVSADSCRVIWNKDVTGQTWDNFLYHHGFPGYFFAFVDDDFIMYDVASDSILQTNDDVPVGRRSWTWPYPDRTPRLVVLDANHVTLYRLDISTAIGDQPHGELPESFTLSEPYPNPFNPTVSFSITVPAKTSLTVDVFNTLGQRVERLFEGDLPAGAKLFQWDGRVYASGVYLIKASTETQTKSVKAVLAK